MIGERFGRLILLEIFNNGKYKYGVFKCDCGETTTKIYSHVIKGATKSCGCLMREHKLSKNFVGTHRLTKTKEFQAWQGALSRCYNHKYKNFHRYGGRGIIVCERWKNSFENFLLDMGVATSPLHTLDRINNNGNYEPSNCRWATWRTQFLNTSLIRWIEHDGKKMTLTGWAKEINISISWLHVQLKTKSIGQVIKEWR